jgi:hypothetical protein
MLAGTPTDGRGWRLAPFKFQMELCTRRASFTEAREANTKRNLAIEICENLGCSTISYGKN